MTVTLDPIEVSGEHGGIREEASELHGHLWIYEMYYHISFRTLVRVGGVYDVATFISCKMCA